MREEREEARGKDGKEGLKSTEDVRKWRLGEIYFKKLGRHVVKVYCREQACPRPVKK